MFVESAEVRTPVPCSTTLSDDDLTPRIHVVVRYEGDLVRVHFDGTADEIDALASALRTAVSMARR